MSRLHRLLTPLLALVLAGLWPVGAYAAITCSVGSQAANASDATPSLSITVPGDSNLVAALLVHDRSESVTIDVAPTGGCTWTLRAGPFDFSGAGTVRAWLYSGASCAAGAATVDLTLSGAVNSHLAVGYCSGGSALSFVSAGAAGAETNNTTPTTTESLTPTTSSVIIGGFATNNAVTISSFSTGDTTDLTAASSRAHVAARTASSGSTNIVVNWSGNITGEAAVMMFEEAGGGGGGGRNLTLLGVGAAR
jgi:hypothetical protein